VLWGLGALGVGCFNRGVLSLYVGPYVGMYCY